MDLVRFMKGLVKLRHYHGPLLLAFQPVIERLQWNITPLSLTNLISSLSFFTSEFARDHEAFFKSLLHAATSRARLAPMSIQHVLTALCRLQGSLARDDLETPLAKLCTQLSAAGVAAQATPIQAVASLTALSKLQHRDCTAAAVLLCVLAGRSRDVAWSWAPSAYFYAHAERSWAEGQALNEKQIHSMFDRSLDSSHCIDVLHSLQRLDLHSALASRLVLLYCGRLVPHLHELRAREVLVVARALSASRLPGKLPQSVEGAAALLSAGGAGTAVPAAGAAADMIAGTPGAPSTWRELAVESCFENLRRHEHFLEASWNTLLPLKLLCMEIDAEAYGTRRLCDVLNPSLLSFVDRLRGLTRLQCEANRLQKLAEQEEGEASGEAAAAAAAAAAAEAAAEVPVQADVVELPRHRLLLSSYTQDYPIDLIIMSTA